MDILSLIHSFFPFSRNLSFCTVYSPLSPLHYHTIPWPFPCSTIHSSCSLHFFKHISLLFVHSTHLACFLEKPTLFLTLLCLFFSHVHFFVTHAPFFFLASFFPCHLSSSLSLPYFIMQFIPCCTLHHTFSLALCSSLFPTFPPSFLPCHLSSSRILPCFIMHSPP